MAGFFLDGSQRREELRAGGGLLDALRFDLVVGGLAGESPSLVTDGSDWRFADGQASGSEGKVHDVVLAGELVVARSLLRRLPLVDQDESFAVA